MSEHAALPSPELSALDQATATPRGPGGALAFESEPPPQPANATAEREASTMTLLRPIAIPSPVNELSVENTPSPKLISALREKQKQAGMESGPQTRVPWAYGPDLEVGLSGPSHYQSSCQLGNLQAAELS